MDEKTTEFVDAIQEIEPKNILTSQEFENGPKLEASKIVITYDGAQWEDFIAEWVHSLKDDYISVMKPTGPGDKGIDVAGFTDNQKLNGVWDNYQCKHSDKVLGFSKIAPEIGKVLWHSFSHHYRAPRYCKFIAPKGASTELLLLLAHSPNLKSRIIHDWDNSIAKRITTTQSIGLSGDFKSYVDMFDFGIFSAPEVSTILEQHKKTGFHASRFGGGIPPRPISDAPPDELSENEVTYTTKLFDAYGEHKGTIINCEKDLSKWSNLKGHFRRSREEFYQAESLRVFVREKTEPGTFESLQDEIYSGVVDAHDAEHSDGFARVKSVTEKAQTLALDAHPLNNSAFPSDRRGICHQLANDERLTWKK